MIRTLTCQGILTKLGYAYGDDDLDKLCKKYGIDSILQTVFGEEHFSYQELIKIYKIFLNTGECVEFENMYILGKGYGVVIKDHIYLCRYNEKMAMEQEQLFLWIYIENKKYVGDVWWYDEEEILEDIQRMPMIQFLEKYKGY